ncbi:cytochrome c551 [Paenibacillus sp. UNC496MF]|uniref:c-type cytochrome n=1 Tax=Paenibacillus sp. UNC496MF TaxID=1502753 RepID=UPI0008EAB1B3|nr:cytochrome c [Paenibacillus sp. UNC496MF]SFJ48101.1 cytochrome c551 [Paenibacillus sp. UNC496MF]
MPIAATLLAPRGAARLLLVLAPAALLMLGGCGSSAKTTIGSADAPQVFKSNCVSCHGTDLQGRMGASTNLTKVGKRMTKDQIEKQIKQGGGGMPAFNGRLSDAQIDELASWLSAKK